MQKRVLRGSPLNNRSYFRVIFALFLATQIISLAINMAVSTFLRNWLAEDAKSYNKSVINSLETAMNSMLTEMTRLVQTTAVVADNAEQLHSYESFTPEDYVLVQQIARDFSSVMGTKLGINTWFYYYPEKNLVISEGSIYNAELYFSKYRSYSNLQQKTIDSMIDTPSRLLLNLDTQNSWSLTGKTINQDVVPFVTSYYSLIRQRALMVVNIQTSDIYNQTLQYQTSDQMGLLIADSEGHTIASWGILQGAEISHEILSNMEQGEYCLTEQSLNGSSVVFLSSKCTFPNWNIHVAYNKSEFYQKSNMLFWSLTAFNLIVTLFGVGLSYLFSRRIFSPIYNLTQLLYPNVSKSALSRWDELRLISTKMQEIQQKNLTLQESLQTIFPSVKQYHLRELLTQPEYPLKPDSREFLEKRFLLPPQAPFLLCRVLVRYRNDFLAQFSLEQQERQRSDVLAVLHTLIQNVCHRAELVQLSPGKTFFLLSLASVPEAQRPLFPETIRSLLQETLKLLEHDRENIRIHFVTSNLIPSAEEIAATCTVLTQACVRIVAVDAESCSFSLPATLPPATFSEISKERVEKLRNLLLADDLSGLEQLFQEVLGNPKDCSLEQAERSYQWLLSGTQDVLQDAHLDPAILDPYAEFDPKTAFSLDELLQVSIALIKTAVDALERQKPSRRQAFGAFVQEHYTDCGLSIEKAAACFQTIPSAFSRSFKEEFGVSFPKYLIQFRIDRAKEMLLSTTLTVDEIAGAVGISNRATFNRVFNQLEGMPPGKYRTLYRSPLGVNDGNN